MHDMEMARGSSTGINLAIGEPELVSRELGFGADMPYPPAEGCEGLLTELRFLHPGRYVVVANGAKQALLAAFYAHKQMGRTAVRHMPPHWPSYPTLAKLVGLEFYNGNTPPPSRKALEEAVHCVTSPNNPDGSQVEGATKCDIWDAAYASELYDWNGVAPDAETWVTSLSKLLGMPGLRIGWLATKNQELARLAAQYVEITTSGVCVPAQRIAENALRSMREDPETHARRGEVVRALMAVNREEMARNLWFTHRVENYGMFAWFRVLPGYRNLFADALLKTGVKLVSGAACGEEQPGWYRMNLAVDTARFRDAVRAINEEVLREDSK